jgi:GNAT superfamily N-acetyltransferase
MDGLIRGAEHIPGAGAPNGVNYYRTQKGNFIISTDPDHLDAEAVFGFLQETKWWNDLTRDSLKQALRHSLCFSLKEDDRQIGVARVITDYVTYAYLCDVYIVEGRRGQGLGSWLIRSVLEHPDLKHLKRVALITHDAQTFYLHLNFHFPPHSDLYMERLR